MTASRTQWDANRARKVGRHATGLPHCSRCGNVRGLNPCRDCATEEEQKALGYPPVPNDLSPDPWSVPYNDARLPTVPRDPVDTRSL